MLIDSNIDWGEGLPFLKTYLDKNGITESIYLGYFGMDNASLRNINYKDELCFPQAGYHAISVNYYHNIYVESGHCLDWIKNFEPIDKSSPSIWIYKIENDFNIDVETQKYCDRFCDVQCKKRDLVFKSSKYNGSCSCRCLGPAP